jgi:uncharacterized membrane protein YkoI
VPTGISVLKGGAGLKKFYKTTVLAAVCAAISLLLTGCGSSSSQSLIGRESAKAIALHDAGLPEKWVIQMDVDYDKQDEGPVYDVFFINATTKYTYIIDGDTGTIVSSNTSPLFPEAD